MKKLKLNIAIAGCYKVAHLHAKAIQQIENGNLKAALSRSQESVLKFAEQYDIKTYQDISRMVTENEIDNVIICKTHPFHLQPTVSAAQAGAHVMVENPLASNLEDCDLMLDACRKSHVKLGVIFQRDGMSLYVVLKKLRAVALCLIQCTIFCPTFHQRILWSCMMQ
jgi:predicted dehydrogenase